MADGKFFEFLKETDTKLKTWFRNSDALKFYKPQHITDAVLSYVMRPAKRLRPAMMLICCGCFADQERVDAILPAAAGLELFHTWTLVHDDIIDNDDLRRGNQTVHVEMKSRGMEDIDLDETTAAEYGRSVAILAGDIQHGWVNASFLSCALSGKIEPSLVITLLHHLETKVIGGLIEGELLDVQLGLLDFNGNIPFSEDDVLRMEWLKTGVLFEFSAIAGGAFGKGVHDLEDNQVKALGTFAGNCGLAFQLQDDILGITGNEKQLGKPVGSDIREGKKTTIVLHALKNADETEKQIILSTLGQRQAKESDVNTVIQLLQDLGGVDYARAKEKELVEKAIPGLEAIPESESKELLFNWAEFMINRQI